jgi:hypothetical protein
MPAIVSAGVGVDQQGLLAARHVDVDVGQQFGVQQRAVQVRPELSTSSRSHSASRLLRLPGNISLAIASVSVTLATTVKPRRPISSSSLFRKLTSNAALWMMILGAAQVLQQFVGDRGELRLVAQEFVADAVDLQRVFVAVAPGFR